MYIVYKHTAPNGKVYIGITARKPEERWENGNGYKCNEHFFKAIQKYGWKNIKHEIMFEGLTKLDAEKKEVKLIAFYDSTNKLKGYNLREGGSVCSFPEQTIEKMKMAHVGKVLSDGQKRKISEALKGRKTSTGNLGHKHSEETKRKMSEKRKNFLKNNLAQMEGCKNPRAVKVQNVDTGEIFSCMKDACQKYGIGHTGISNACSGKIRTSGGYRWRYVESEVI